MYPVWLDSFILRITYTINEGFMLAFLWRDASYCNLGMKKTISKLKMETVNLKT